MRRTLAAALTLVILAGPVEAGMADRIGATFSLMADDFIQTFNPVEALVVAIDNDDIFLDVGSGRGAQVGQEYTIYRKGGVFSHPLTGKPLGATRRCSVTRRCGAWSRISRRRRSCRSPTSRGPYPRTARASHAGA